MDYAEKYNKIYSDNAITFGGGKPDIIVQDILKYRNSGSVFELGTGEGRNSLYLAHQGFAVTAQDISEVGIEKLTKQATDHKLNIKTEVSDIRAINFDQNFDVFVSTFMLHHLSREESLELIKQIQNHTNLGGLNAIATFTRDGDFYGNDTETDRFYPDKNGLKNLYADWEILEYTESQTKAFAKRLDGSPMLNITARLLAKKPR